MKLEIKKGTTSKRIALFIQNSSVTTGAGLTGLLFNSAGLTWYYWRENEGNVGGTAVTLATATRGTFASGGFIEKDATNLPGFYEIGIPDAALATGADWVVMQLKGATNMAQLTLEIQLVDNTALDIFNRVGAPAGASVSADVAAVQDDTDNLQTRVPAALVGGRMDANASAIDGNAASAANLKQSTLAIVTAVVGAGSTTTSIVTSSMSPAAAVADQFKGKIVSFAEDTTTVNLRGQSTDITASTAVGVLTCTALTTAAVSGDTFAVT